MVTTPKFKSTGKMKQVKGKVSSWKFGLSLLGVFLTDLL
jgi:hypothetical protein